MSADIILSSASKYLICCKRAGKSEIHYSDMAKSASLESYCSVISVDGIGRWEILQGGNRTL